MKKTSVVVFGLLAYLAAAGSGRAANQTWTGGGADNFWLTGGNWLGGLSPAADDTLYFGGNIRTGSTNNYTAGTAFGGIVFAEPAGAFILGGSSVSLAGNITNGQVVTVESIDLPLSLAINPVTVDVVSNGTLVIGSPISGGAGLNVVDGGQVSLTAANTFTGPLSVQTGTVLASVDSNLGAAPATPTAGDLVLNGGTLHATNTFTINANRGLAVGSAAGGMGTFKVDAGLTVTYGGVIAGNGGNGGLAKSSFGSLTLFGTNSYTGPTIIQNGTLTLSYGTAGAPPTNIISSSSPLTVGGLTAGVGQTNYAQLVMTGAAGATNAQTFDNTLIDVGGEVIQATNGTGGSVNLALGSLTHNIGGTVVLIPPAAAAGGSISTTATNFNGIIGGWATVGTTANQNGVEMGTNYATVNASGNIVNFTNYLLYASGLLNGQVSPMTNLLFNPPAGISQVMSVAADNSGATVDVNAIKMYTTNTYSGIYIGPGNVLRLGRFGGILAQETGQAPVLTLGGVNNSVQSGNGTSGAQNIGTLTAGGAPNTPGEIVLDINNNNETSGSFIIESLITDNGTGPVSFVKTGPGPMKLDGQNTFSGGLYLLQGRLQFAGSEIGNNNPSGGGTGPIYIYPGAEFFPSGVGNAAITNNIFMSGNGVSDGVGAIRLTGVFSNGVMTLIGDSRLGGGTATVPIYDQITGPYNLDFGATGNSGGSGFNNGCLLYNQSNNWTGNTTIVGRTGSAGNTLLRNGTNDVIPDGFGFGNLQFGNSGNTVSITAWDMNGFNETINGLVSLGTVPALMYISNNTANATSVLTLGNNDQSGSFSGAILGNIALTKIGAGEETLTGTNLYTGKTTINAGTLALSGFGSITGGGVIVVNSAGTFDVSAATPFSTPNPVAVNGGTMVGNGSVGSLSMTNGALTLGLVPGPANITATGITTGGSTNYINISSVTGISGYPVTFNVIQYSGSLHGVGNNFGLGTVPNSDTVGYVTNNTAASTIQLVLLNGPKVLTWTGTDPVNPTYWDQNITTNWLAFAGTPNQAPSTFNTADSTYFDDTASTNYVSLNNMMQPGVVSVNNSVLNYTFGGSGALFGGMSLTKSGSATLAFYDTGGDNYKGGVTVNGGTVIFGQNNGIIGGVNIASGATVQVGTNGGAGMLPGGNVNNAGTLIFDAGTNLTAANAISGMGTVNKIDTNILTLSGASTTLTGAVNVVAGTLKAANGSALGSGASTTTISSGATLDVNDQTLDAVPVVVSGTGVGGLGAIINSSQTQDLTAMGNVTMAGDTSWGGSAGRWDIRGGAATLSTSGNPYNLTKVGTNYMALVGVSVDGGLGNINVLAGLFSVETNTTGLGNSSYTLTVSSGATLQLYGASNPLNKNLVLNGNGVATTMNCGSGTANTFAGPITLNNNCIFNGGSGVDLTLSGAITGSGSFTALSAGTNTITGAASYTGGTVVSNGTLVVDGSLAGNVTVYKAAIIGGLGTFSGNVTLGTNSVVAPGDLASTPTGTLNINGLAMTNSIFALTLGSSPTNLSGNDLVNITNWTFAGTNVLQIIPASFMNVGDQFTVVQYGGTALPAAVTNNLGVVSTRAGFTFALVNPATTPNAIKIQVVNALGNDFWTGVASASWDTNTLNWTRSGNAVNFNNNDYANFTDSSSVTNVNLTTNLSISEVTVSSSGEVYQFLGSGGLTGSGGLHLAGVGLVVANTGTNNYTGPIQIDSGLLQVGNGGLGGSLGSGIITNNGSLVFDVAGTNLSVPNNIFGAGGITNVGAGEVSLGGASTFTGPVVVQQGTVRVLSSTALGSPTYSSTTVSNGATLDITNSANLALYSIYASGAGVSNNGAIINSSGSSTFVNQNIQTLYLQGDTTFGGSGRLDLRSNNGTNATAYLYGGYNLTKVGTNLLQLAGVNVDPGLENINVGGGTFGIQWQFPYGLGDQNGTLSVSNGATFAFFDMSNAITKNLVLNDGSTVAGQAGTNVFSGPVTLNGNDNFNISAAWLELNNTVSGSGNLVKTGTSQLILSSAAETYTGNTYVDQGMLSLSDVATISASPLIVLSNATLDVSLANNDTLTLGGGAIGQTLAGPGTITGNLVVDSGSTVNPGNGISTGTLTVTNAITLGGAVIIDLNRTNTQNSDEIVAPSIIAGGTLTVTNLGPDLVTSNVFQLFNGPVTGFASVNLPAQNASQTINYVWQNNLAVNGSLLLIQGASLVNTNPATVNFQGASGAGGTLKFTWDPSHQGWQLYTNVVSLTSTNWFPIPGSSSVTNETITINPANPYVFFQLRYP